jgi:hypothetical protein
LFETLSYVFLCFYVFLPFLVVILGLLIVLCWSKCASNYNNGDSGYSNHILYEGHKDGTTTNTMDIVRIQRKGKHLNRLEKYQICRMNKNILHMNDTNIDTHNQIFRPLQEMNTS